MTRPLFAAIVVAIVLIVFLGMWIGWRARARRDATIVLSQAAPVGAVVAEFGKVLYVSTTPAGEPLTRVAVPGLRYRGPAEIAVHEDGVTVQVFGEDEVHFSATRLRGSGSAGRRVGKAVEHDGLALMRWEPLISAASVTPATEATASQSRVLELSFRFESKDEQKRFSEAIDKISVFTPTSEEGAQS